MAQNMPFIFQAGNGQSVPVQPAQQQHMTSPPPRQLPNGQATVVPPAQQQAVQQNAQLPGVDMSALAGISPEQIALIARLFQSGALTLPPAPPAAPAQEQTPPPAPARNGSPQPSSQSRAPPVRQEDVDMDREEGELEEGEVGDSAKQRDFLRPPPTGPRQRSVTPRDRFADASGDRRAPSPDRCVVSPRPANTRKVSDDRVVNGHVSKQSSAPTMNGQRPISRDAAAKAFIQTLHEAGYTFEQLSKEVSNPEPLRRLFKSLGLPVPAEMADSHQAQPKGEVETGPAANSRQVSLTKRPAPPRAAAPVDRSAYLAKLQAARNKRSESSAAVRRASQPTEPPTSAIPATEQSKPATSSAVTRTARSIIQTDLVKQRLEAFRARQAARLQDAQSGLSAVAALSSPPSRVPRAVEPSEVPQPLNSQVKSGLGAGFSDIPANIAEMAVIPSQQPLPAQVSRLPPAPPQAAFSPTPPTPNRTFNGLPGLFLASTPVQPSPFSSQQPPAQAVQNGKTLVASPAASPAPLTVPRKRPVAADFIEDISATSAPSAPKRSLFGESRTNSATEQMIIEVSDDDEDEEDDSDEDVTKGGDARNASAMQPRPFRNTGPLSNFPQRANFSGQSSVSAPGTPNVDYQRKTKEIEDLKRKIAEKEARAKTNGQTNGNIAPSSADDQLRSSNTNTPTAEQAHVKGQFFPVDTEDETIRQQDLPSERRLSAAALWRRQEKEKLQQRLQELQQAMPKALKRGLDSTAGQEADVQMGSDNVEDGEVVDPVEDHQAIEENAEEGEVDEEPNAYLQIANRDDKMDSQATTVRRSQSEFNGVAPAPTTVGEAVPSQQDDEVAIAGNCLVVGEANQLASNASHADEEFEGDLGSEEEEDFYGEQAQHEGPTSDTNVRVHSTAPENDAKDEDEDEARDENEDEDGEDEDEDDEKDLDNPNMPADHPMLGNAPTSPDINMTDEDEAKVEADLDGEVGNVEIEDGDGTSSASEYEPEPIQATTTANDDLAPELQPPDEEQTAVSDQGSQPTKYYTPYQSPLTRFKDYRYHPEFLNNVPGGFKSLTFSHKIDPTQPLCPFEAAGGKCNDKNCQYQHFSSMGLSDNELLKVLGTPSIPNPDDDRRWKEGLGAVVKQLRGTNLGRDAAAIAARIAEFRREFVGDPTKTINLG